MLVFALPSIEDIVDELKKTIGTAACWQVAAPGSPADPVLFEDQAERIAGLKDALTDSKFSIPKLVALLGLSEHDLLVGLVRLGLRGGTPPIQPLLRTYQDFIMFGIDVFDGVDLVAARLDHQRSLQYLVNQVRQVAARPSN